MHSDSHHDQKIEIEVLPAPHGIGDHPLAAIKGKAHEITFTSEDNTGAQLKRPIIVGYPMRFDYLSWDYPAVPVGMEEYLEKFGPDRYTAERITLRNETPHPVVLGDQAEENQIESKGPVTDLGAGNEIGSSARESE